MTTVPEHAVAAGATAAAQSRVSSGGPAGQAGDRLSVSAYDLAVVGGGAGGIAAARAGARRGLSTVLVQDGRLGGDCTFAGCVPSKSLVEAAVHRRSFDDAMELVHEAVERVAGTESAEVLRGEGITVVEGRARFVGPRTLVAGTITVRAHRVVLATGSAPLVPPIPGLSDVAYLTNETVFDLATLPRSLAVLGGGTIGCELAQVFRRFGAQVHVFEAADRLLSREEPEASAVVADALLADGVVLHLSAAVARVERRGDGDGVRVVSSDGSGVDADQLLVAVGRRPVTAGLEPHAGGVELDARGSVATDRYLRTSAPGVYAIGDVTGRLLFTHAADEMGRLAVRNAGRRLGRSGFEISAIPWVTFTDPEVAHIGLTEAEADGALGANVAFQPMTAVDRAVVAGRTEGFVKLIAGPRRLLGSVGGGRILGATIVCPRAGEMIHEVALAMRTQMFAGRLAQTVHAYPTWSTAVRQAAGQFFVEVDGRRARPARPSRQA